MLAIVHTFNFLILVGKGRVHSKVRLGCRAVSSEVMVHNELLFSSQNNPPTIVRERVLGLVQYWADAFQGRPQLQAVRELYEQLKADGMEFPPVDLDQMAPVDTPERVSVCVGGALFLIATPLAVSYGAECPYGSTVNTQHTASWSPGTYSGYLPP